MMAPAMSNLLFWLGIGAAQPNGLLCAETFPRNGLLLRNGDASARILSVRPAVSRTGRNFCHLRRRFESAND
jgi:hypothetical protein